MGNDAHCIRGYESDAPTDFDAIDDPTMGVCTDRCTKKRCPQYYKCKIEGLMPVCYCDYFRCSESLELPVEASRYTDGGAVHSTTFINSCALVNANCALYTDDSNTDVWYATSLPGVT